MNERTAYAIIQAALEESSEAWYEPRSEASNGGILVDVHDSYVTFPGGYPDDAPDAFEMTITMAVRRHEVHAKCYVTLEFPFDIGDEIDMTRAIVRAHILDLASFTHCKKGLPDEH